MFVQEASSYRTAPRTINSCTNTAAFMGNGTEEGAQSRLISRPASRTWAQTYCRHQCVRVCVCVFVTERFKVTTNREGSLLLVLDIFFWVNFSEGGKCVWIFFFFFLIFFNYLQKDFQPFYSNLLHRVKSSHTNTQSIRCCFKSIRVKNISQEWGLK